jgi:hypothetical protein
MSDYPKNCLNRDATRTAYSRNEIDPKSEFLLVSRRHTHRQHVRPAEIAVELTTDVVPIVGRTEPRLHRRQKRRNQQVQGAQVGAHIEPEKIA